MTLFQYIVYPWFMLLLFVMILLVLGLAARFWNKATGFTDYMKRTCFGIYVLHIPILLVMNYYLEGSGLPMVLIYAIELVGALVLSTILYEILSRVPVVRYWIFGIRKQKEDDVLLEWTREDFMKRLEEMNAVGMSGSGFSVVDKLETFLQNKDSGENYIIINGAECDPALLHDGWLMKHYGDKLRAMARHLLELFEAQEVTFTTRESENTEFNLMGEKITMCHVPRRFPYGEEHLLAGYVFDKEYDVNIPMAQYGVLVLNVQTLFELICIYKNNYQPQRLVTLGDLTTGDAVVAWVDYETPIKEYMDKNFPDAKGTLVAGGGFGYAHPVEEGECFDPTICFAGITYESSISNENSCKRCGKCTRNCPMGINVKAIVRAKEKNPQADISAFEPEKCMQCQTCTYFCRASKDVAAYLQ